MMFMSVPHRFRQALAGLRHLLSQTLMSGCLAERVVLLRVWQAG
jgi:hypothetical protein